MSVSVPDYIDAFDARLYFVTSLKKLNVSQQSILKCRSFALRYTDWYEDLYRCIIEVMESGNIWSRMYLLYFLDSLIERSMLVKFKGYTEFILEDLEKIVGLVCKKPEGSVNLVNTLKTLERWQTKNFFNSDVLEKVRVLLLAWKLEPEYPPELNLTANDIKQRMEDDRERAKLLREDSWWIDKSIEDGEALALWEETSDLDEGDYIDIITENIKQDPNYDWKSLYEEVKAWNKELVKFEKEEMNCDLENVLRPIKRITFSKIPRPTQAGWTKYEKRDPINSEIQSKIPRLKGLSLDIIQNNPKGEPLGSLKGEQDKAEENHSEFESMTASTSTFTSVATTMSSQAPISSSEHKAEPIVVPLTLNPTNNMLTSSCLEKSITKRKHDTDDIFQDISDEQHKQKAQKKMPVHGELSTTSEIKISRKSDSKELSDQNSSYVSEEDSEEADEEISNNFVDHLPESNLEFLLQAVELVSPMTEVSLSKEDSPSRDELNNDLVYNFLV
ncbi:5640_t:CDS:2 [Funneliformis geosporum]|uniref:359_t:CDS:1 n=1 Tax=Funneliformis geosporum TaxID=1117311 RepID=A0A9W4T0V9_9GLOM|nr:359_t:CDS:2 [Funneliformis geosporum]CAI2186538.1 5640_t:CDS:2 [Funneliformis geosporum]